MTVTEERPLVFILYLYRQEAETLLAFLETGVRTAENATTLAMLRSVLEGLTNG